MQDILLEGLYVLSGLIAFMTGIMALRDNEHPARIGTASFWMIVGVLFIFGKYIPSNINGFLILIMGVLTAARQVKFGSLKEASDEFRANQSKRLGNKIFIPALTISVFAFGIAQFSSLGGLVGLGIGALTALIIAMVLTKSQPVTVAEDGSRLLQQIGAASMLPQLLAALGALFNASGVGQVISQGISGIIPEGNIVFGVVAYAVGMALFTMIMGNAFAAFAVITAGVGLPFVLQQGGNPAVVGALALTAGYCGTLLTPMAANFNVVPAALLEMKDNNKVIKSQLPLSLILLLVHIVLMLILGF